jgi:tetratricopeptide (TPR) repeat protein
MRITQNYTRFSRLLAALLLLLQPVLVYSTDLGVFRQLIDDGQPEQALSQIAQALEQDKENLALQALQADAIAATGNTADAITRYQQLIQQFPQRAELYNNLAILLARQGNYEAARDALDKGLKTSETYAVIYDNLSNIYMEMARDSYGKALQLGLELKTPALKKLAITTEAAEKMTVASNTASQQPATPITVAKADTEVPNTVVTPIEGEQAEPQTADEALLTNEQAEPQAVDDAPLTNEQAEPSTMDEVQPLFPTSVMAAKADINSNKQDVIDSLQSWAAAWAAQAPDLYLSFYHQEFRVPDGQARAAWEADRQQRLRQPEWIQVELDEMKVELQNQDKARVTLVQSYRSNTYQDKVRKQMVLANTAEGWRILRERSLGLVR